MSYMCNRELIAWTTAKGGHTPTTQVTARANMHFVEVRHKISFELWEKSSSKFSLCGSMTQNFTWAVRVCKSHLNCASMRMKFVIHPQLKWDFEHIKHQAKILDYVEWSNKSNINQTQGLLCGINFSGAGRVLKALWDRFGLLLHKKGTAC